MGQDGADDAKGGGAAVLGTEPKSRAGVQFALDPDEHPTSGQGANLLILC